MAENNYYEDNKAAAAAFGANLSAVGEWSADFDLIAKKYDIRYGMSYASFEDLIKKFDVSRLPDYEGATMPLVGHIIMTRPSLNVNTGMGGATAGAGGNASKNFQTMLSLPMSMAFASDYYGKQLLHMLSDYNRSAYMPIFTNKAMSYAVNDISLKTVEKSQTYYGHVLKYAKHSEEHKHGGTISIDFRNDRYMSVLKTCYLWFSYIWNVSKTDLIIPSDTSQKNGIIDYGGSLYYLVTDLGMSKLVYWEKLTGVFPKTLPMSIFSYSDAPIIEDKVSIEFDYGLRSDPCDPDVLVDINVLSASSVAEAQRFFTYGLSGQRGRDRYDTHPSNWHMTRPDSFKGNFALGNAFAVAPIIKGVQDIDGTVSFYLQYKTYN